MNNYRNSGLSEKGGSVKQESLLSRVAFKKCAADSNELTAKRVAASGVRTGAF